MHKPLVLVVEDDKAIRHLITTTLDTQNYKYMVAESGAEAVLAMVSHNPEVTLLDLGLPDMDGLAIIKKVRTWSNRPIIVVSARNQDGDKIAALDAGADDYLSKPFSVGELLARIRVSLRRASMMKEETLQSAPLFHNGGLQINYEAGSVALDHREIHLTPIEYKLLVLLAKNVGKVLTHNYILHEVWGAYSDNVPALRVFMATLRGKIEADTSQPLYIQTHVGVGYRMLQQTEEAE